MNKLGIKDNACCVCGVDSNTAVCSKCIIKEEDRKEALSILVHSIKNRHEESTKKEEADDKSK